MALREQLEAHEQDRRAGRPVDLAAAGAVQEAHARTIEAVRATPGFERFGLAPRYEEIAAAVPDDEALVYLFSAPDGSAALIVRRGAEPEVVTAPELTSGRVVRTLMRGGPDGEPTGGYLVAQAAGSEELDSEIAALAAMLGPELLEPLAAHLEQRGVAVLCVVAAALLGQVPLHALPWDSAGTCLVERFDVVSAPSALARGVCLQRAAERDTPGVVLAVGNPLPHPDPLRWAQEEARVVADVLPSTETVLLIGEGATAAAVARELPRARYAHLACHGSAAVSPLALDSRLYFAHAEPLSGADLIGVGTGEARLVVASACETAISPSYEAADEALSLGTVLLGAGAAGAIASLWAVDDLATALLMSRFYEELRDGTTPARALRVAMLWVRDLRFDEAVEYARARPALRGRAEGVPAGAALDRPFGAPRMWAAFVLSGA
jgi:CHAT domain-containing protein